MPPCKRKKFPFFRFHKLIVISILAVVCVACSSEKAGLRELKKLCEKDAGLTIYKTVEADGYYDDTTKCQYCWHGLIANPFEYIEFCDSESTRHPLTHALKEHGCYRLSKVTRTSGQCHVEINEDVEKSVIEPFVSFKEKQCIKVEPIDKPDLSLALLLNDEAMILKENFDIYRYEYTIKSIANNQKYGRFINYSLVVKTVGGAGYGCGSSAVTGQRVSVKNPSFYKAFISKVIKDKQ